MNFPFGSNPNDFFQQMNMGTNPFGGNTMFSSMGPSNMGGLSNNNFGHSSQTITSSSPGGGIVITTISRGPNGTQRTQRIIGGNQQQQQQQLQGHEGLEGDDDFAQFMNGFPFMMPQMQMGQQQQQQGGNRRPVSILDLFSMSFNGTNINIEDLVNMLGPREQGLDKEMLNSFATVKFDKEKSKSLDPELKKCAICMEDFEDQEEIKFLLCTHRFHSQCIDPWLEKHTTCPVCKKDFSKLTEQDLQ